jgi:arabinofuranosyltransferase
MAVAAALAWSHSGTDLVGYDDANIFFTYARNLLGGHGFVFNAGGERVEGFTSLLWLLTCSAAMALTPRFEIALFVVNVVLLTAALTMLQRFTASLLVRYGAATRTGAVMCSLALTLTLVLAPGYVMWNVVSLMDSGLWSALLLAGAVVALRSALPQPSGRDRWTLAAIIAALVLTRPEAMVLAPVLIVLAIAIDAGKGAGWSHAGRRNAASLIALVTTAAAITAWRLAYFGHPLPNSYYAKLGDPLDARVREGGNYFLDFAGENPAVTVALGAAAWGAVAAFARYRSARHDERMRTLLLLQGSLFVLLVAGCLIPVFEGGDQFAFWRMYQPLVPLVALQAVLAVAMIAGSRAPRTRALRLPAFAIVLVMAALPWRLWTELDELQFRTVAGPTDGEWSSPRVEMSIAQDMREIAGNFNRAFPRLRPRVGVIVAGGFSFVYHGETIDLMGANNAAMAHAPGPRTGMRNYAAFNHAVFDTLAPDAILLGLWSPHQWDWFEFPMISGHFDALPYYQQNYFDRRAKSVAIFDGAVLKGLLQQRGALYAWASVRPSPDVRWIHAVFRKDFLTQLRELDYEVVLPGPAPGK